MSIDVRTAQAVQDVIDSRIRSAEANRASTHLAEVVEIDKQGTVWVHMFGGADRTPVSKVLAHVEKGDVVMATIEDGSVTLMGSPSSPAASEKQVEKAAGEAAEARDTAIGAVENAAIAEAAAKSAQGSAAIANNAANSALDQLGVVQDVVGVLNYVAEHGGFVRTQDQEIAEGKVYFTLDSQTGDYVPVVKPQASALSSYYEVSEDYDDVMGDFIMAHLAVTSRGLWVLPSGMGSSTTPASGESQADSDARQGANYKMLLSSDGTYIYDGSGDMVIKYGQNIEPSTDRPFYIGDPDSTSYILFTPASGSTPASISIGGSVKIGTSKTLSELLAEVDAKAARGTGILKVTTAPSSYTTQTGGFTPTYRIALSTVKSQAGVDDVVVGDVIEYSYYHYPVGYVDSSYAYTGARTSIRGATGTAGGRWYTGTGITGTSTTATIFSGSGVSSAVVGDMYLNTETDNTYRCTTAGDASTAKWVYVANIEGERGPTGPEAIVSVYPTVVDFGASTATLTANLLVDGSAPTSTPTYQWSKGSTTLGTSQTQTVTDLSAVYTCVVTWGTNVQAGCFDFGSLAEAAAVAGNYIIETASNDVWVHSEGHGPNSSGVATSDTYGWRIGSVFELVRAGLSYIKMWVDTNLVAKVRVGLDTAGHIILSPSGMEVFDYDANTAVSVAQFGKSGARVGRSNGKHIAVDTDGLKAYTDSSTEVAAFGATSHIGATSGKHVAVDSDGMTVKDNTTELAKIGSSGFHIGKANTYTSNYFSVDSNGNGIFQGAKLVVRDSPYDPATDATSCIIKHHYVKVANIDQNDNYHAVSLYASSDSARSGIWDEVGSKWVLNYLNDKVTIPNTVALENGTALWDNTGGVTHIQTPIVSSKRAEFTFETDGKFYHRTSTNSGSTWSGYAAVGEVVESDVSSAVSVATSSYKSITSVSLNAGKWVIAYGGQFATNATGVRSAYLYTSQNAAASAAWYRASLVQGPAASGQNTYMRGTCVVELTSTTTVYLTLWQNSGSSLSCYGNIRAIRVW